MLRLRSLGLGASVVALVAFATLPAQAQGVGAAAGIVSGTVNLSPGFTFTPAPAPLQNQNFTFAGVTLVGAVASSVGGGLFASSASASGVSIAENVGGGVGTLSASAAPGTCSIEGIVTCPAPVTAQVTLNLCSGLYVRVGVLVIVELGVNTGGLGLCTETVTAQLGTETGAGVVLVPVSLFLANQTPPTTISSASFDGVFAAAAAAA